MRGSPLAEVPAPVCALTPSLGAELGGHLLTDPRGHQRPHQDDATSQVAKLLHRAPRLLKVAGLVGPRPQPPAPSPVTRALAAS